MSSSIKIGKILASVYAKGQYIVHTLKDKLLTSNAAALQATGMK